MDLFLVKSLAFLAASLALLLARALSIIALASLGFSSKKAFSFKEKKVSTAPLASLFPSFALVWPSNCGSGIFTDTIAVIPSLISSPWRFSSFSFIRLKLLA